MELHHILKNLIGEDKFSFAVSFFQKTTARQLKVRVRAVWDSITLVMPSVVNEEPSKKKFRETSCS